MSRFDYWEECVSIAADDCGLSMTKEQLQCVAGAVQSGHENYGQAFYSPPASDRLSEIERKWESKYKALEKELETYKSNAVVAMRQALKLRHDAHITIEEHGGVFEHGGRTERVQ